MFGDYFKKIAGDLRLLSEDIDKMISNKEGEAPHMSPNSIQPQTRIYKDVSEAKEAQENPEIAFVKGKLKDILG